jgi:hypothetical protein
MWRCRAGEGAVLVGQHVRSGEGEAAVVEIPFPRGELSGGIA